MRVDFLGVVDAGGAMVRVNVNNPLVPKICITIAEAEDHARRLADAIADARRIQVSINGARGKAGDARPSDTEQPAS